MSRLIVVSNRVAIPQEKQAGGLAAALQSALAEHGGIWFGWSGKQADRSAGEVHRQTDGPITYATIDLGRRDYDDYYRGFANGVLWPLFHYRPDLVDYQRENYEGYLRVNQLFAEQLARLVQPDDTIWVHDYHLIPLASELRAAGIDNRIGFFLHTPLAPAELLSTLPQHRKLFETLTAYDLVGLQTRQDVHAFNEYFDNANSHAPAPADRSTQPADRRMRGHHFPISIDTRHLANVARSAANSAATRRLQRGLDDRALVIGVDRLDYSKGLLKRFDAFASMLERSTRWQRRVCLLQIAPPSRGDVPEYQQIRHELERRAGHLNGALGEPDWVPIHYVNQTIPHATLTGYFRAARVGLVTPLRDGMNLVAKEYVASQDPGDPGVLVLSRFAGAAEEMTSAIQVNPHDEDAVAEGLEKALDMPLAERRERWRAMMDVLEENDITVWRRHFLDTLAACPR